MQFDSGLNSENCAIFDKDGVNVYVVSEDDSIKVFKTTTNEKERELKGHEDAVLDLTWDDQKVGYLISTARYVCGNDKLLNYIPAFHIKLYSCY